MPRVRRASLPVEASRQLREATARLGGEIREMRLRRGWTQAELGRRAGIGRMVVSRAERGVSRLDVEALERIGLAFGRRLTVTFGRDPIDGPADAGHLALQELVLRLGRQAGYRTGFELPTKPADPWRSADVALRDDRSRRLVIAECWNTIGDIGAAARSSMRKLAEAEDVAVGWWGTDPSSVHVVWVVRATARNRRLVATYPEVFAARLPGSSATWVRALRHGTPPPVEPGLVWCDVSATRIVAWRRS